MFGGVVTNTTHGWEKIANGIALLAFAILGIRIARLGIFAGPDELVVRDYFRTYRIAWPDVSAFEMPPPYGTWRKAGLRIRLHDGRLISATLYARGRIDSGTAVRTVMEKLEQFRQQRLRDAGAAQQPSTTISEYDQPG